MAEHDPSSAAAPAREVHAWVAEPLEETLGGARRLTADVVDRCVAGWWEHLRRAAGIPERRWRANHPVHGRIVDIVDGEAVFDAAAWVRFACLVPGAVALPTRTAAAMGVARAELVPPAPAPGRIRDLLRARRARRRLRRAERDLPADLARFRSALHRTVLEPALAPGADGTTFAELPAYTLAARMERLLDTSRDWSVLGTIELALGEATAALDAWIDHAGMERDPRAQTLHGEVSAGSGVAVHEHVEAMEQLAHAAAGPSDITGMIEWLRRYGWYAPRDLPLESEPYVRRPETVTRWLEQIRRTGSAGRVAADAAPASTQDENGLLGQVPTAIRTRLRQITGHREAIARDRAALHAAIRALVWTLADTLQSAGLVASADDVFDLSLDELLRLARGGRPGVRDAGSANGPTLSRAADEHELSVSRAASDLDDDRSEPVTLRGHPASRGVVTGRVIVLREPTPDLDVTGAILVCRATDPGWMPLLIRCAGLVTDRGGPLAHAAIVARELGVPAVVGTGRATAELHDGMLVRVDGAAGTVVSVAPPPHG